MDSYIYILPIFVIVGTIGNVLTLAVYSRETLRMFSVTLYLVAYSVENTLVLFLVYGGSWVSMVTPYPEVENLSDWGCRVWQYVHRMLMHYNIWILVAVTLDRYIYVCHRHRANNFCTKFISKAALILIGIGVTVVSIHAMWTYELRDGHCLPVMQSLHYVIWNWFSASCLTFVPLLLLILLDILLVVGLCTQSKQVPVCRKDEICSDLTITVLGLSLIYLTFALPATIVNIVYYILPRSSFADASFMHGLKWATYITNFMSCVNQCLLFVICVLFSASFRKELKNLLRCCPDSKEVDLDIDMPTTSTVQGACIEQCNNENETLL